MITEYIAGAMQKATYELLEDGTFYGEIPDCEGVWSQANTLESCRENLQDALELTFSRLFKTKNNIGEKKSQETAKSNSVDQ
jgi:predicted RNase H-like HicB family nuclease